MAATGCLPSLASTLQFFLILPTLSLYFFQPGYILSCHRPKQLYSSSNRRNTYAEGHLASIKGLLDTDIDVTIILSKSLPLYWPFQEINIQFLGIQILAQLRQSTRWVEFIGPEVQVGKVKLYLANIVVNLWGHDLLHQRKP